MYSKALRFRFTRLISKLKRIRTIFRIGLLLVMLTVVIITIKSRIPRIGLSTTVSSNAYTILNVIHSTDGSYAAYVFKQGIVYVKKKYDNRFPNNQSLSNKTGNNLSLILNALILDQTANCTLKATPLGNLNNQNASSKRQPYLCTVGRFVPRHPCYCFSFGFTDDLQFETEMEYTTPCQVFAFDPGMKRASHMRSERLLLFKQGLSDTFVQSSRLQASKDNILGYLSRFNARHVTIDVVKIELGAREWSVLKRAVSDGSLENVKQLILRIRSKEGEVVSDEEYRSRINTLRNLHKAGFHLYNSQVIENIKSTYTCLTYLNAKCVLEDGTCVHRGSSKITIPLHTLMFSKTPQYNHLKKAKIAHLSAMSTVTLESLYFELVQQQHLFCPLRRRIGDINDGGWDVCFTHPFGITTSKPCIAFSFGINYVWGYDDELAEVYNCRVYMFDPSMKLGDHQRLKTSWFYRTGLSPNNTIEPNGWKMRTLCHLFDELGHSNDTIDILKIDIEYWEWSAFETALKDGCLRRVKQLMFESHTNGLFRKDSHYAQYIRVLLGIFDVGFRTWKWHMNPVSVFHNSSTKMIRPCCYEHYLLNTRFIGWKT